MSRKITQKELDQGLVDDLVLQSEKGAPNGVPTLDSSSKIPVSQIPLLGGANIGSSAITNAKMSGDVKVGSLAALNTTSKTDVTSAINEVSSRTGSLASLNTTAKTNLVASINELFQFANDGKTRWSSVIGSPLLSSDTFTQMETKTQTIKNTLATNLTAKGQSSTGTETLTALIDKVGNISISPSAGDFLYSSKPTGSVRSTSMVKLGGDTTINYTGVARIRFKFRTGGAGTSFARIYRNGVAYGTLRSTSNTTDVTITQDLSFNAGDVIALWGESPSSTDWIYGGNLDVLGSIAPWAT